MKRLGCKKVNILGDMEILFFRNTPLQFQVKIADSKGIRINICIVLIQLNKNNF